MAISPMNSPRPSVASERYLAAHALGDAHETRLDDVHLLAPLPLAKEHLSGREIAAEAGKEWVGHRVREV